MFKVVWQESFDCTIADPDARGLERSAVQRDVEDFSVGGVVLYIPHDVRKLRPLQPSRCYSCRGFLV